MSPRNILPEIQKDHQKIPEKQGFEWSGEEGTWLEFFLSGVAENEPYLSATLKTLLAD